MECQLSVSQRTKMSMSIIINTHLKLMLLKQQKDFSKNYENLSNLIEKKLSMI